MPNPLLSVVIPVKNEQHNIGRMLHGLRQHLPEDTEIIIVRHCFGDKTIDAMRDQAFPRPLIWPVECGGVADQLKRGFQEARGEAILVTMADICDDPADIPQMLYRFLADDMVCASRYMKGGRQIGAPRIKSWLSWAAGWSLHALGLPTHDPSNSYKLYRASKLKELDLNSCQGFDINLEIMAKALEANWRISEVPTTWRGRTHGDSSFRFWKWLPFYARWWCVIAWRLTTRL